MEGGDCKQRTGRNHGRRWGGQVYLDHCLRSSHRIPRYQYVVGWAGFGGVTSYLPLQLEVGAVIWVAHPGGSLVGVVGVSPTIMGLG
jgi:hypothetical protein